MGQEKTKKRIALGMKSNKKGDSFQGRIKLNRNTVMTAFVQCDNKGNPNIYQAKDGTPIMYIQTHYFDNAKRNNKNPLD
jgi:hypothetical protein